MHLVFATLLSLIRIIGLGLTTDIKPQLARAKSTCIRLCLTDQSRLSWPKVFGRVAASPPATGPLDDQPLADIDQMIQGAAAGDHESGAQRKTRRHGLQQRFFSHTNTPSAAAGQQPGYTPNGLLSGGNVICYLSEPPFRLRQITMAEVGQLMEYCTWYPRLVRTQLSGTSCRSGGL